MSDKKDEPSSSETKATALHPAYTVSNIGNKIRTLDGTKVTYSSWTKLFRLHAKAYKVLNHIDGTAPPIETDEGYALWAEIDALVLQWIYATLSDDYLVRVLDTNATAYSTWIKIQQMFLSNKGSRAAALDQEFSNLTLGACSSMDAYCQKLKDLADQLEDVGQTVPESRLVLQLVRGLPSEFDTVGAFINQSTPSWDTARSMLQLEVHRQSARQNQTQTVLAAPHPPDPDHRVVPQPSGTYSYDHRTGHNPGRGRGQNHYRGRGRNSRGRGRQQRNYYQHHGPPNSTWSPHPTPPAPFPTAPYRLNGPSYPAGPPQPFTGLPHGSAHMAASPTTIASPSPTTPSSFAGFSDYGPHELANAMQQAHLNTSDSSWYMDTGASSHLTSDQGIFLLLCILLLFLLFLSGMALVSQYRGLETPHTTPQTAHII